MRYLLVLVAVVAAVWAEQFSYEGYKVFRLNLSHENQLRALASFNKNEIVDFWSSLRFDGNPIDVMVKPEMQHIFGWFLNVNSIKHEILIDNVQDVVQKERVMQQRAPRMPQGRISFEKYNKHDEINAYLEQLARDHPDVATLENIGKSYEGRDLKILKISTDPSANKPVIFVDAGIHAREWLAPAQATYIINQLVEVAENRKLLDKVDWYVLPVVNPDGYEYTHSNQRLWRKTRSVGQRCIGTDANRNFGFHWGEIGASTDECSDTYMGKSAFSEVESQAVRDCIWKYKDNIKLYLTFHSYGRYLLCPWGFTSAFPDDYDELKALGDNVAYTIRRVKGTIYTVGTSTNVLYAAAGGSDDWAKGVAGVQLAYTIELPEGGSWGFDPPPHQIMDHLPETWEGCKAYNHYIGAKFGK
ncbi:hypothetical protein ILUMI_16549 [Ignelater luminosus]|uniref:Zinc carboxypeptidase A 1 n=1 Tax=Ignelater luminosus TaxID=2038154 RepID=A0A8K0CS37_IGNLU|nr:hypothetical protein ILUMI_16549 [Ignelater luminosus]